MKLFNTPLAAMLAILCTAAGIAHPDVARAQSSAGGVDVSQQPLFTASGQPPLNMLVMGKDHKIYYEAYNDASDLNGDGALDIGYKPAILDYYGYFNSHACYNWATDKFVPTGATANKQCSGNWSGDFLNYLTTSRMDALRRVLFGGWRQVDSTTETVLQGAFFPQDGHSWGKEYQSVARDGYNISNYSPLAVPSPGRYHLFAVTTVTGNDNSFPNYQAPLFRVLKDTDKRVWNWLSIEGPVAGNKCFTAGNTRVDCVPAASTGTWGLVPASMLSGLSITTWKRTNGSGNPTTAADYNTLFNDNANASNLCGTGSVTQINATGSDNNPFSGTNGCTHNNYLTEIAGTITVPTTGLYRFAVDGDDGVEVTIAGTVVATWYGGHGNDRSDAGLLSHSNTINLTAGAHSVRFRHQEGSGGDNWGLFMFTPAISTTRDDYLVRVRTCPASNTAVHEPTCKAYPNGQYKPTGILHDYGESDRMYFGLITGSQFNNLEGGVLRKNMSSFADEIDPATGQFLTGVDGIVNTIDRLRMIGGGYNGGTTNNLNSDSNWNWANGTGTCTSQGNRALNNGECRMWGNPLAEMLYESMRYFAGAGTPTARFNVGASTPGNSEETTLALTKATWKDPYAPAPAGGGFLACSKPFQTIISDINPSYDGDLPGSAFAGAITSTTTTPTSIASFNAATEGQAIWNEEFGAGARDVFIGDVNNVTDGAPTSKSASSFGNIRGLSPEEPTKGGTYYSASVARFARNNDLNAVTGDQNLSTYAIALASPLPRIDFPIGDGKISLLPFAKTPSGTFGGGTRKPTNTIVDFYVESIANLPGQPFDATVNGGLPIAVFRINYEDVEQGNDHDMDAIVRYLIVANADGTVTVTLNSEYAAGSADQNMGYVMSGTTQDGVYLDVRDTDSGAGSYQPYALNTPNPVLPGGCGATTPPAACNSQLPLTSTRIFTPSGSNGGAIFLNDPLWYAAKQGAPDPTANDENGDGVPDNYFLVTNPATLRSQLDAAFAGIIDNAQPTASVATSTPRYVPGATLAYEASYSQRDWSGDIKAFRLRSDGTYNSGGVPVWSASGRMPAPAARSVFTAEPITGGYRGVAFTSAGLDAAMEARLMGSLDPTIYDIDELIAYLKGDQSQEQGATGCTVPTDCPYRVRGSKIGDILNSTPAVVGVSSFGYGSVLETVAPTAASSYPAYVEAKKVIYGSTSQNPILYVGSNDGMLHALDGRDTSTGGTELFAYIPNAVLGNLNQLVQPGYVHRYFVDGSPTITDAYLGGWKTILAGSMGAGGRGVYALDISNPRAFAATDVLWEFNYDPAHDPVSADMGQFLGRPYMGITEGGQWVAAFGNGLNSENQRAVLFIRDLATGAEIATLDTGVGCLSTDANCVEGPNGLATAVLVDNSGNGAADTIYAGDYLGNMWRFEQDMSSGVWSVGNGGSPIFTALDPTGKPQSITSGAYTVANPLGGTMVIFGTGRYLNPDDADETRIGQGTRAELETIYGIWDSRSWDDVNSAWTAFFPISSRSGGVHAELEQQQITSYTPLGVGGIDGYREATRNPVDYRLTATGPGQLGWYLDLACTGCPLPDRALIDGERVTATPQGILSNVIFNTFRPEGDTCEPGSLNATMVLDALTGAADYIPIEPVGGWPTGYQPPDGTLAGTDTVRGPPPGEPPIVLIRPAPDALALPGSPGYVPPCTPGTPGCEAPVEECAWRSPNSAGRPPGKAIPCGRISWRQIR